MTTKPEPTPLRSTADISFDAWRTDDIDERLGHLAALGPAREAELLIGVGEARRAGRSWQRIADLLGISKQAAYQKYADELEPKGDDETSGPSRKKRAKQLWVIRDQTGQIVLIGEQISEDDPKFQEYVRAHEANAGAPTSTDEDLRADLALNASDDAA